MECERDGGTRSLFSREDPARSEKGKFLRANPEGGPTHPMHVRGGKRKSCRKKGSLSARGRRRQTLSKSVIDANCVPGHGRFSNFSQYGLGVVDFSLVRAVAGRCSILQTTFRRWGAWLLQIDVPSVSLPCSCFCVSRQGRTRTTHSGVFRRRSDFRAGRVMRSISAPGSSEFLQR
jgi:hypothetical protein